MQKTFGISPSHSKLLLNLNYDDDDDTTVMMMTMIRMMMITMMMMMVRCTQRVSWQSQSSIDIDSLLANLNTVAIVIMMIVILFMMIMRMILIGD